MSQFIPTNGVSHARVRTGFERVVAHRVGMPFAYVAKENGKVLDKNDELKVLTIQYTKSKQKVLIEYGEQYSRNSSESFHVTQKPVVNKLNKGSRFKEGDVLVYNESFFSPDPFSNQVDLRIGVMSDVAFLDTANTQDDSCIVTKELSEKLTIEPVDTKVITIDKNIKLYKYAMIGDEVQSIDPIMVFDEVDLGDEDTSTEVGVVMETLNKSLPKSPATGKVVNIEVFYRGDLKDMSPSLRTFIQKVNSTKNAIAKIAKSNNIPYSAPGSIQSDKLEGKTLDINTVLIKYYIQEEVTMSTTDKVVFAGALKSVCAQVTDKSPMDEDGNKLDAIMGAMSVQNRIVLSPLWHGGLEKIMEKIEKDVLEAYFG